jgi:hypothetical protein
MTMPQWPLPHLSERHTRIERQEANREKILTELVELLQETLAFYADPVMYGYDHGARARAVLPKPVEAAPKRAA